MLFYPEFMTQVSQGITFILEHSTEFPNMGILFGTPMIDDKNNMFNSAVLVQNGAILFQYDKYHLPNYDVFDESRYFKQGGTLFPATFKGKVLELVLEDGWTSLSQNK